MKETYNILVAMKNEEPMISTTTDSRLEAGRIVARLLRDWDTVVAQTQDWLEGTS
jgi:hypothetical protein